MGQSGWKQGNCDFCRQEISINVYLYECRLYLRRHFLNGFRREIDMTAMVASAMDWGESIIWRRAWGLSLASWAFVISGLCSFVGLLWDGAWHASWGRDTFFIPPHDMMYGGITLSMGMAVAVLVTSSRRRMRDLSMVQIGPLRGTPGHLDCDGRHGVHVLGSLLMTTGGTTRLGMWKGISSSGAHRTFWDCWVPWARWAARSCLCCARCPFQHAPTASPSGFGKGWMCPPSG